MSRQPDVESNRHETPAAKWWNGDRNLSLAAIFIAFLSLALAINEFREGRQFNRLSMLPFASVGFSINESGSGFTFDRTGPGPVVVGSLEVLVDNIPQSDWPSVADSLGLDPNTVYRFKYLYPEYIFPTDSGSPLFWVESPKTEVRTLLQQYHRVTITLCYSSVYGDHWITDSKSGIPRQVDECPPGLRQFGRTSLQEHFE